MPGGRHRVLLHLLPWAVAAGAVVVAVWPREAPRHPATLRREAPPPPEPTRPPTDDCPARLADQRSQLALCQKTLAERGPAAPTCSAEACLADPAVQTAIEREAVLRAARKVLVSPYDDADGGPPAGRTLRIPRGIVEKLIEGELGIRPRDLESVRQYVCAARDQRNELLGRLRAGNADPALWQRIRRDRQVLLRDLREFLGLERYGALRSVGGLGLLIDLLGCE